MQRHFRSTFQMPALFVLLGIYNSFAKLNSRIHLLFRCNLCKTLLTDSHFILIAHKGDSRHLVAADMTQSFSTSSAMVLRETKQKNILTYYDPCFESGQIGPRNCFTRGLEHRSDVQRKEKRSPLHLHNMIKGNHVVQQ